MKIAIVGSGISGLLSAWLLDPGHDVTVFEAQAHVGGHTHTHDIEIADGRWAVDTGFIVYNERTYPEFIRLLDRLGVDSLETDMSFSCSNARTGIEYCGSGVNGLLADRRNLLRPDFYRLVRDILRFNRQARQAHGGAGTAINARVHAGWSSEDVELTLGEFLQRERYSRAFVDNYILGMGAAIWSKPVCEVLAFPARAFFGFFDNHGLLDLAGRPPWRVIRGGSRKYVRAIEARLRRPVRTRTPVRAVTRCEDGVRLDLDDDAGVAFDAVILACHSDQALALLTDPSPAEREVLGAIRYRENDVVLHTDERLLPGHRRAWAAWNYRVPDAADAPVAVTYNMNLLQRLQAPVTFCVTLNQSELVDDSSVLRRLRYAHPVFDARALRAQQRHAEISGVRRTWYAGAWWRHGFHEDGVRSALRVAADFGIAC